ncbi:ABC transporter ATP-binding protein [Peribacillus simplex]|uniref:ABC transporter ATP-binding protein n=1 Tax=Peribacillus simplex TaxID=1478 RepID=UPI003D270263
MKTIFNIENVTKEYPKRKIKANNDITFEIYEGEILALLGPNGAGKSTLIKQMMGLIKPSIGRVYFNGKDVHENSKYLTENVAYYSQDPHAITSLRVWESLYFTSRLRGFSKSAALYETDQLLDEIGLKEYKNEYLKSLSGGQKRLVSVALTLTGNPKVLIFDEPTNELDPVKRRKVWELITNKNKEGATIILVTHNILEAEQVVDRVAIINEGRLITLDEIEKLKQKVDQRMRLDISTFDKRVATIIYNSWGDGLVQSITEHKLRVLVKKNELIPVIKKLLQLNLNNDFEFSLVPPTLEDVYLQVEGERLNNESIGV